MTAPTVFILAAGKNSRFFPLNTIHTKSGTQILGQPIILRTLKGLEENGLTTAVVIVSSQTSQDILQSEIAKAQLKIEVRFSIQTKPAGMADAVLLATAEHQDVVGEQFVVTLGHYPEAGQVIAQMLATNQSQVLAGQHTDQPHEYGIFRVVDDRITGLVEKPKAGTEPSNMKAVVVHLLESSFLSLLNQTFSEANTEYSYELALDSWIQQSEVHLLELTEEMPSLKYPWHLFVFFTTLINQTGSSISQTAQINPTAQLDDQFGPIIIEDGAQIGHTARIVGPAYIGRNAIVGDFSLIRGSSLEEKVVIGAYTEVARSIFLPNSSCHFGYVADSIIDREVKIGAGLLTANKRLDRQRISVEIAGTKIATDLTQLGLIAGANTQIGIGVKAMPGTLVGPNQEIMPQSVIKHTIV